MTKKNVSWPLITAIGALGLGAALFGPACTVSSGDDDDLDVDAGAGGSTGGSSGGSKATGGSAGSSTGGSSGGSTGGSAGSSTGGSAGTGGGSGGTAGAAPMLACDGETVIPWPNCDADATDDECTACLKAECCDEWRDCAASDETAGDFVCGWGGPTGNGEFGCIADCMRMGGTDTAECAGMCIASGWDDAPCTDGTVTQATSDLLLCMEDGPACQAECFE